MRQAEIIVDQAPELRDKIEVVYNSLPLEMINITPRKELNNTPTFLYVGGDSYVKGFHILLRALSKLAKQGVRAGFILTNKYSTRSLEALRRLSNKYGNLDIQVLGRMEYEKLKELYMEAWALLFPSICEETFGYAVVEASMLGTIPIASNVGATQNY
jgi:glycosyltransferase involved in cell wall biosynthesis